MKAPRCAIQDRCFGKIDGSVLVLSRTGPLDVNFLAASGQFVLTAVLLMSNFRMLFTGDFQKRHDAPIRPGRSVKPADIPTRPTLVQWLGRRGSLIPAIGIRL